MNIIDNFWLQNLQSIMKDFKLDSDVIDEVAVSQSLKNIRQFISTNSTNKDIIVHSSSVPSQLRFLCDTISCGSDIHEYGFLDELLGTLNSLASVQDFRQQLINIDFIKLLFRYIITMNGCLRKNSILLLRTLLNARNINVTLNQNMDIYNFIKTCVTPHIMNNLVVIPCISFTWDDCLDQNGLIEKRTCLFTLQLLSVLATDSELNHLMFSDQNDLLNVLHRLLMQLYTQYNDHNDSLTMGCSKTETKYVLKILAFYLFYDSGSIDQFLQVVPCDQFQDLIKSYEFIFWMGDKCCVALLGLIRGLMFWRSCLKLKERNNLSVHAITNCGEYISAIGLGLTAEDIVKLIINPMTMSDLYLEFNGLGCWLLHALFLVLHEHYNISELLMQCNGFLDTINKKITPKIQSGLEQDDYGSTDVLAIEKLSPLLKLLAWMSSQSDCVKISIGESDFFAVILESYQKNYPLEIPNSTEALNFQKSIWLLIQALSRNIYLHRTLFYNVAKYSNFIKEFARFFMSIALLRTTDSSYYSTIIEITHSCMLTIANLILPTSPLRNDLLEWAIEKFISMTNGEMIQLTDSYPELKLCGMIGLVNATYSLTCHDNFSSDENHDLQDSYLLKITSHLLNVTPSTLGTLTPKETETLDLSDKVVLMIWGLFRNTLRSIQHNEQMLHSHSCDIINFIVSTLESQHAAVVKEQAMIVLAQIASNNVCRDQVLNNEDLKEKIKLFMRSANPQLKSAAINAAIIITDSDSPGEYVDLLVLLDAVREEYKDLFQYLQNVKKHDSDY